MKNTRINLKNKILHLKTFKAMMKKYLLIVLIFSILKTFLNAQISIKREDFAVSTARVDSGQWKLMTKTNGRIPALGNNQLWDYSALKDSQTSVYSNYFVPATNYGILPVAFPDANLAYNFRTIFNSVANYPSRGFQKLDSTGYYKLGFTTTGGKFSLASLTREPDDSLFFLSDTIRYKSSVLLYKFPMSLNSIWRSKYIDTINCRITISALGLSKSPGQRVSIYNAIDSVAGWGTLRLQNPSGGLPLNYAVLLHKHNDTRVDSFFLEGQPAWEVFLNLAQVEQGQISNSPTIYKFLGAGFKEPLLYLSVNANGAISTIYRAVLPNLGLTVGDKNVPNISIKTLVYPNPANSQINFEFDKNTLKDWNILIYNDSGQLLSINRITGSIGLIKHTIDIDNTFSNGIYFYNLIDETSLIRAKGSFEVFKK
jgi:hypothetical protein